ncbi:MAG: hypothetical protein Kow0068_19920 [Marinilabiliales bacterium]
MTFGQFSNDSLIERHIRPGDTDPSIWLWNADSHYVYINPTATIINKLFVFLPGSYGVPEADKAINIKAANMGYHSIGLRYPNTWSMIGQCGNSTDLDCHLKLRNEVFYGIDTYSGFNVDSVDCIKNRLIRLLKYLDYNYPAENWGQFLDVNDEPVWNKIILAGHSQGGGYGGIVGKDYELFRIINFASNDYNFTYEQPAPWYYEPHVTPTDRYYGMVHIMDGPSEFLEMMDALGVDTFAVINADTSYLPYNYAKILITSEIPATGTNWVDYHNSVAVDNSIPVDSLGNFKFDPVWEYLLSVDSIMTSNDNDIYNAYSYLSIFPNPVNNESKVVFTIRETRKIKFSIYNYLGVLLDNISISSDFKTGTYTFNLKNIVKNLEKYPSGLYFLSLTSSYTQETQSFIIKK